MAVLNIPFEPTVRQWQALEALQIPRTAEDWERVQQDTEPIDVNYGGGKGGGKSYWECKVAMAYCLAIAAFFQLPDVGPRGDVPHVAWMGRKVAQVFVGTTLETWKQIIPQAAYTLVAASEKHPRHIRIGNCIAIDYGGLDSRAELERFNSAEYGLVIVDQAEETTRDDVATLKASRRKKLYHPGKRKELFLPYRGIWTCNPRVCWLYEDFILDPTPRRIFIPALYKDNPHLPPAYVKTLEESFAHRPDLLRAYRDGVWEGLSGVDQVVLQEWITAARMRLGHESAIKRLVSVDPARYGDDLAVILGLENTRIVGATYMGQCSGTDLAQEVHVMTRLLGDCVAVVEQVGADTLSDLLVEQGVRVIRYNPSEAASEPDKYVNKRAETHSKVAKWMQSGIWDKRHGQMFSLPEPEKYDGDDISPLWQAWYNVCRQMTWPKYKFRGERVLIQPKEEIKDEHDGKSPDFGDCYLNGVAHLDQVETIEVRRREDQRQAQHYRRDRVDRRGGRYRKVCL